jgi:exodeoxyribonuclease VIII
MTATATTPDSGLLFNQSAEDYHATPGASASRLSKLARSPAHLKHSLDFPDEPTKAMIIGSATHSAILEPHLFTQEWARLPDGHGSSKIVKEAKAELAEKFEPNNILKGSDYDTIIAMRDSVLDNNLACDLLFASEHNELYDTVVARTEVSARWVDEKSWVPCKARIDAVPCTESIWSDCIIDIKTTANCSPEEFRRSCFNFGYYRQAAHYLSSLNHLSEEGELGSRDRFIFICVEKSPPHCVATYELDPDALALGRQELDGLLALWSECEEAQEWPSYPVEVQELSLPGWAYTR